ncbi:MAG: NAD(P)/FAD-dependent oxidoreductase [Ilumatobacteraceae bacterium]
MPGTTSPAPSCTAIVVGGGPGGLMAAEVLATAGLNVTLVEHMPSVGRKFLLAGRSGLNLTHSEPLERMVPRYGDAAPRLDAALRAFDAGALREWSAGLGEPTFIGTSGRVFPTSLRGAPLLRAWLRRLDELGVRALTRTRWTGWSPDGALLVRDRDGTQQTLASDVVVFALGGASWPRVGSDGGWVARFRDAGIEVHDLRPANCGVRIAWSDDFIERHAGAPLKNVALRVGDVVVRGDAVITATGMEGGPVYGVSAAVRAAVDRDGVASMLVDLHPDLDVPQVATRLGRRRPKDSVSTTLKRTLGLSPAAVAVLREPSVGRLPTSPDHLAAHLKAVPVRVDDVMPIDRAISSAGGVALDEVDDAFMLRRRPGTYVVGEMLDWEAPTGGYLLQATFATAVTAARAAVDRLAADRLLR